MTTTQVITTYTHHSLSTDVLIPAGRK